MRKIINSATNEIELKCNRCGREIPVRGDIPQEDVFCVEKTWGYFSEKDGTKHRWDVCEKCYRDIIKGFVIPIEETDCTELL